MITINKTITKHIYKHPDSETKAKLDDILALLKKNEADNAKILEQANKLDKSSNQLQEAINKNTPT